MPYRDSARVTTVLSLQGVWIMDPDTGGQVSARQYLYGKSQREESLDPMGEDAYYAGRKDPVVDYGEHEGYAFQVTLNIPHGPTWRTQVEDLRAWAMAKKVLHIRDNRGRALYCTLDGMRVRDTDWGSQVSFTATRASRVQEVVSA